MKIKIVLHFFIASLFSILTLGCASTNQVAEKTISKEIPAAEFFSRDFSLQQEADNGTNYLVVKSVYMFKYDEKVWWGASSDKLWGENSIYSLPLIYTFFKENPEFSDRVEKNRPYDVHITLAKNVPGFYATNFNGEKTLYDYKIDKIEEFRTLEEINAEKSGPKEISAEEFFTKENGNLENEARVGTRHLVINSVLVKHEKDFWNNDYRWGNSEEYFDFDRTLYNDESIDSFIKKNNLEDRIEEGRTYDVYISILEYEPDRYKFTVEKIEGLRSKEEVEAAKKAVEEKKVAEEAANRKRLDSIGRQIAKGYVYHGIDEKLDNAHLVSSNALQPGHAYYISDFMLLTDKGNNYASISLFWTSYMDFKNQKIKGDLVLKASKAKFADVIIAGRNDWGNPIVIGIVE